MINKQGEPNFKKNLFDKSKSPNNFSVYLKCDTLKKYIKTNRPS